MNLEVGNTIHPIAEPNRLKLESLIIVYENHIQQFLAQSNCYIHLNYGGSGGTYNYYFLGKLYSHPCVPIIQGQGERVHDSND